MTKCKCGCGEECKPGNVWINGHNGRHQSKEAREMNRQAMHAKNPMDNPEICRRHKEAVNSPEFIEKQREGSLGNQYALDSRHSEKTKKGYHQRMMGNQCGVNPSIKTIEKIRQTMLKPRDCICINCGSNFMSTANSLYCNKCNPNKYCDKWNEECKETNREKYNRKCFFCGKSEKENGAKHSSHHIDSNKNQGCDDTPEWKLVPLCRQCHGIAHGNKENRNLWESRIIYLHKNYWEEI